MTGLLRLAQLSMRAKLRAVGWGPWIVLVLWATAAAFGEPLMLRSYGIRIAPQAILAGSLILMVLLLVSAGSPRRLAAHLLANVLLACLIAAIAGALSFASASVVGGEFSMGTAAGDAATFALACLPLCVAVAISVQNGPQQYVNYGLVSLCAATTIAVLTDGIDRGGFLRASGAVAASIGACALWMACSRRSAMMIASHEDRNTR